LRLIRRMVIGNRPLDLPSLQYDARLLLLRCRD
jgi:hypothetical protein